MGASPTEPGTTILVPLDGSVPATHALRYAQELAGPAGEIVLLRVVPPEEPTRHRARRAVAAGEPAGTARAAAASGLAAIADSLRAGGQSAKVRILIAVGEAAAQIVRVATEERPELIVMATHGRGALGRWVFGSVADRVARSAPTPVLIARETVPASPAGPPVIRRLVVPLDGSDLAARSLPFVAALAIRRQLPVHLVTIVDVATQTSPLVAYGAAFSDRLHDDLIAEATAQARRAHAAATVALAAEGLTPTSEIRCGSPISGLLATIEPADLVVVTSHGRGGISRWLMGSVAERLVRAAPAPVVVLRPPLAE